MTLGNINFENIWWLQSAIYLLLGLIAYAINLKIFVVLKEKAKRTVNLFDDAVIGALQPPVNAAILIITIYLTIEQIDHEYKLALLSDNNLLLIAIAILTSWFALRLIRIRENQILKGNIETKLDLTTFSAIFKVLRLCVIFFTLMVVFQTLGISISGLVAFGGVGGAAIAFASKDLLANFFGGLMIYLDKQFSVGDWVRSPEKNIEGTVEHIGWRVTRIRTFDKRPLYVPNSVFTQISIENPSRMSHRRIYESIGVRYSDFSQVEKICKEIEALLQQHPEIDESQTLMVNFNRFADSSLEFFIYCFTHTTNWQFFHQIKQDVLLKVGEIILQNNAEIAFPSHSVYVEQHNPVGKN